MYANEIKTLKEAIRYINNRCDYPHIIYAKPKTMLIRIESGNGFGIDTECELLFTYKEGNTEKCCVKLNSGKIKPCCTKNKFKEKIMRDINYISKNSYVVVEVTFKGSGGTWIFKADETLFLEKGDTVVIDTVNGLALATVNSIFNDCLDNSSEFNLATAWVVDKVNFSSFNEKKKITEERQYILNKLQEKAKAFEAVNMYRLMAQYDPEAKELLNKLSVFDGVIIEDDK